MEIAIAILLGCFLVAMGLLSYRRFHKDYGEKEER